ncbi:hypothetical protein [Gaoshiqia sediminis]|uniref:V-type ATP synthase subunit E n=1 Tax=Gaoshiqia sediminis TaxID=2986998 RepID=A0AA41YC32_9BACT|nr:hypothetical protein [Gaoshiqia sediminis]MCW0483475.1 hypothetical protein [Gaoshiqia sediminis]
MNTKIKELTENIYNEGVAKARAEADKILAEARAEAEKTTTEANEKATAMLSEAKSESEKIYTSLKAELQAISDQVIEITKQNVTNLVTAHSSAKIAKEITSDPKFIKDLVLEIARTWSEADGQEHHLDILVPETMYSKLEPLFKAAASEVMGAKLVIKPVAELKQGFQLVKDSDSFKISFTDEEFKTFFMSLMKPKVKDFLFNTEK